MLSDRSYMRSDYDRGSASVLTWLLGILVGVFVLQNVARIWFNSGVMEHFFALSTGGVRSGFIWGFFTYALLHDGIFHLLASGLGLFFFGRELEALLGPKKFIKMLVATALGGALAWFAVHFRPTAGAGVIGASAIVAGLLTVFACLYPRRPITLLLFFVIPVTIQPIWMLAVWGGIDVLGFLFWELPGRGSISHSAHLGGMAAGWIFYQMAVARSVGFTPGAAPVVEAPAWLRRKSSRPGPKFTVNIGGAPAAPAKTAPPAPRVARASSRDVLRAEVDRILDKINLHGFGALTPEEKRVLDEARQHINPR